MYSFIRRHIWLIAALVIAALSGRMLLTNHHFYTHDDIQVFRVQEFMECFGRGELPCRWSDSLGKGYGYPWFNYYPPMIYVVPSLLHLLGLSIITSLNLFMFLTFLLAAWSMYLLAKELAEREDLAFFASLLYTLYPFHAINVFTRGVYAENLAWSLAPLLMFLLYRQVKSTIFMRLLPLCFALLFLTHVISSFILTGLTLFWVILLSWVERKNLWHSLLQVAVQLLIGLGIAAFFFVPAIAERGLVQSDSLTQGYYAYTNHYVSSFQLFQEYKWNYDASLWNEAPDEMPFMVGHVHTLTLLLTACLVALALLKGKITPARILRLWLAAGLGAAMLGFLFLSHFKSDPIWTLIPPLAYVQFPWRFIVWAGLPLVTTIILLISLLPKKLGHLIIILSSIALLIYSYPFFFPKSYDTYKDADLISGPQRPEQQVKSLYDYLPITVHQVPELYADEAAVDIPVFYFPGWTANVPIQADPIYGLIEPVSPDDQVTDLQWRETPFRLAMDLLSLLSLIGYLMYNKRYGQS